ncbi:MAG TPA: tetratricopeptide repeat protein [Spirochaetota bacterium]|nr:tetratricopeptide repeat protein [Spirochaetota bacterium]HPS86574.1 tetratricopeptide repeat protein [Spirochaetota bacterium]
MNKISKTIYISAVLIIITLSSAHVSDAQNAISLNRDGWVSFKKTEYDRALFSFTNSLRLNSRYSDSMIGAGKSYYALGVYDRALEMFSDALKMDGNSVDALNGIGMVLSETGRFTDAIGYFEKAVKISGDSIDSEYGIAYVYYKMDKRLWAKRKLENIFKSNPYHFQSLLLMADIKTDEGRLKEAREYVEKAIDSAGESPDGHIKYGSILFKNYMITGDADSLDEARESYNRALAINPSNFRANMDMGLISLMEIEDYNFNSALTGGGSADIIKGKRDAAVSYILKAAEVNKSRPVLYSLSLAYDMSGDKTGALEHMLSAYKKFPSDSLLKGKLEDFLVLNEYKSAHPARIMLSNENIELSKLNRRESLHTNVIYYLRRSLLMNPLNRDVREQLINYYSILDYNKLMIDEMKNVMMQYPEFKYQDMLNLAIIKRRDRLYVREGYSSDEAPRDVPNILVLNFNSAGKITDHPDSGKIAARNLTFALQQFGRMRTPGLGEREALVGNLKTGGENLFDTIKKVKEISDKGEQKFDFLIFGEISEVDDYISITFKIMDLNRGYIIYELTESRKGRENLNLLSILTAEKIYNIIPYGGKVLKVKDDGIILNLGLYDGVKEGTELVIYRDSNSRLNNETIRYVETFTVKEADTFISYAEPDRPDILRELDSTNSVYPLMKRRARKIE